MNRRQFLELLGALGFTPGLTSCLALGSGALYPAPAFGNVTLLHITDCHAQLLPVYYREPEHKAVISGARPETYLTGQDFLKFFGIMPSSREAYAFTQLNFTEAASIFGKMGGFAHLAALTKQIKSDSPHGNVLLLDGGDSWQGSATALWTQGHDMVAACNLLGVDIMTGHWEFTFGSNQVLENLKQFNGEFVAQNCSLSEEAQFASSAETAGVFKPYVIKEFNNARIAVIGQAYPYTPIANPKRFIPDWQFGIQEQRLQQTIDAIRRQKSADAVILLSHNGLDIDLKLASRVVGIDVILGGHTHDALPKPVWVENPGGKTCVTNAGSHGKFLGVVDLNIRNGRLQDLRYRLLPVFSDLLEPDPAMLKLIGQLRQPYLQRLQQPLGVADKLLYRRDTWKGSFDQLLLDALLKTLDAQIAFSPGFRWGTTLLPGDVLTYEEIMNQCAITYPNTLRRTLTGVDIKNILEDAADNVFHQDAYYRQGGDMVRTGGMTFVCNPYAETGRRISDMRLKTGELVADDKAYEVASWAAVNQEANGMAMSDVLASYLKSQ